MSAAGARDLAGFLALAAAASWLYLGVRGGGDRKALVGLMGWVTAGLVVAWIVFGYVAPSTAPDCPGAVVTDEFGVDHCFTQ